MPDYIQKTLDLFREMGFEPQIEGEKIILVP